MNSIFTVIKFTFMTAFTAKSFKISSLIMVLLVTIGINLPAVISQFSSNEPDKVGVFASQTEIAAKLDAFYKSHKAPTVQIVTLPGGSKEANEQLGKEKIKSKEIKGYLEVSDQIVGGFPKVTYKSDDTKNSALMRELQMGLQAVKTDGILKNIPKEQLDIIQAPIALDTLQISTSNEAVGGGKTEGEMIMSYIMVYAMLMLQYMSIMMYGTAVATTITQEKSTRVMELLVTSVDSLKQMLGKIIGTCFIALSQLGVLGIAAAINLMLPHNQQEISSLGIHLSDIPVSTFIYFIIFFLGGFFLYAVLYAAVGSIVSRVEDVGQAVMPIMFLMIAGFMVSMVALQNPNASHVVVMSFIPFFSPLIMFLRIGMGNPEQWEILVSIAILIVSTGFFTWLAAKIYRTGVMLYGKRPTIKELRRAMKAFKA
ncbi:ABC transporter permease [Paenibacillus sp. KN14-4R]|uniref:ABC transporter permease n=1 Tax=Paenibacillus sp. KN14-4R TaxID=3445773 RepID=UPI003F9EC9F2